MACDLFPDYLKRFIDKQYIVLENLSGVGTGFNYIFLLNEIILNRNDSLENQIMTLLHEICHLHPKFMSYTGALWYSNYAKRSEEIEKDIDKYALKIYNELPDIVNLARDTLNNVN